MLLRCRFVFFFKQKTAYEMRISDWSSDVCSSDLRIVGSCTGRAEGDLRSGKALAGEKLFACRVCRDPHDITGGTAYRRKLDDPARAATACRCQSGWGQ